MKEVSAAQFDMNRNDECVSNGKKDTKYVKFEINQLSPRFGQPGYDTAKKEYDDLHKEVERLVSDRKQYYCFGDIPYELGKDLDLEICASYSDCKVAGDEGDIRELAERVEDYLKKYETFSFQFKKKTFKAFEFEVREDEDGNKIELGDIVAYAGYHRVGFGKVVKTTPKCWGFESGEITSPSDEVHVIKKANGAPVKISDFGQVV